MVDNIKFSINLGFYYCRDILALSSNLNRVSKNNSFYTFINIYQYNN